MHDVTFRYLVVFYDKNVRYFVNMAELRKYMRNVPLSLVERFEKYYKKPALWVRVWIKF